MTVSYTHLDVYKRQVPMTVFIDKDGYVQTSYLGPINEAILKSYSETLFNLKL